MRMPPSPASADERTNANTTMRGTLIPITAAALRLNATAISALPSSERRRNICTAKTVPSAATMMNSSCGKMPAEPIWRTASPNGEGNLICSGPHRFTAAFLRMMLTATVLSTQLRESAWRITGRMAPRSSAAPITPVSSTAAITATA